MQADELIARVAKKEAVVGVIGLGYVGLPLVLAFGRRGFRVIGLDIDAKKVRSIERSESYIKHIASADLAPLVADGRLVATTDFARAKDCDCLLLCLPTPLNRNREPDLSYVTDTAGTIAAGLRRGQLVILESTTYPGTTDGVLREVLERGSGLVAGRDFFLAYSPEREDPGNPSFETSNIPKLVGALSDEGRAAAVALYEAVLDKVVPVTDARVAETAKLLENIFRAVNIALVNELKVLCHEMGIDVWEVISAAATKPFGFMPFYPGPGLGGHCIPIDPFYLTWKAREYGLSTRFIELAGEINIGMPRYVVDRTAEALNQGKKPLHGARIMVLGLAYKKDVDDTRESPAFPIIALLRAGGAEVSYHDPFVPMMPTKREYDLGLSSEPLDAETLAKKDAVLIVTDHSDIDYELVVDHAPIIIDTRNATARARNRRDHAHKIFKA